MLILDPITAYQLKDTVECQRSICCAATFMLKTLLTQRPNTVLIIVAHRGSIASFFNKLGVTVNVRHTGIVQVSGDRCEGVLKMVYKGDTIAAIDKTTKDRAFMEPGCTMMLPCLWPAHGCHVFIMRHGTSVSNMVAGVPDGELIWEGVEQAKRAAAALSSLIPDGKDVQIICSGMVRAVQTAHIIYDHLK